MSIKIEWNKVTKLSQIVAIILFVAVFLFGLYTGRKFENKLIFGDVITKAKFVCPNNKFINTEFYDRMVRIEFLGRENIYLPQTISASGARYANKDETLVFWNKGDSAFIEENGEIILNDCVIK